MAPEEIRNLFKSIYGRDPTSTEVKAMMRMRGESTKEDTVDNEVNLPDDTMEGDWREVMSRDFF